MGITKDTWIWDDPPMHDFREPLKQNLLREAEADLLCALTILRKNIDVITGAEAIVETIRRIENRQEARIIGQDERTPRQARDGTDI